MTRRFYITTPIYYPNGQPHLGSIYTTVLADILARYHRLSGEPTYFLTGTDEHGTKMAKAAAAEGVEPIDVATRYANIFKQSWKDLEITNDDFIRTTEPRHKEQVTRIVEKMLASGDIYLGAYEGWYDEGQEQFVTETEAKTTEYKSAISGKPLTRYSEPTYFFKLSKYVPKVLEYIAANPDFIKPESRKNEVVSKLKVGVDDLSISRATLKWGIPMPNDPSHVVYVWIDALTNYITALGYAANDHKKFDDYWPCNVHLIGKDILWFHAVYWPAMLMSLGLPQPKHIVAHGWWVSNGRKSGKSTGGITTLAEIKELSAIYSFDSLRYHMVRTAPVGSDLEWSLEELLRSYTELGNVVGNLLNRTLNMIGKYRDGKVPESVEKTEKDHAMIAELDQFPQSISSAYEGLDLQRAALEPIELARAVNTYIDQTAPFKLAKDPTAAKQLDTVLNLCAQGCKKALAALLPILPNKAAAGLAQLNVETNGKSFNDLLTTELAAGHQLGTAAVLFPKVETK